MAALPLGGTLVLSDDPEDVSRPGVLAAAWVRGPVRVLVDEHNASRRPLRVRVFLVNPGPGPLLWQAGGSAGAEAPLPRTLWASEAALTHLLQPHAVRPLVSLPAHRALDLTPAGVRPDLLPGDVAVAWTDGVVLGSRAQVAVEALPAGTPPPSLAPLPPAPGHPLMRGAFPLTGRVFTADVSARAPSEFVLQEPRGLEDNPVGYSVLDHRQAVDRGGYGLEDDLVLFFRPRAPRGLRLVLVPRGGPFAGVMQVQGGTRPHVLVFPPPARAARITVTLPTLGPGPVRIRVMVAAGSFLPVVLRCEPLGGT